MNESLVIVESPAKGKTIKKYLGKGFEVLASYGHVRDLIPKEGAIDVDNNFAMYYELIERNAKHVKNIIKALKETKNLYLATDPDREGEAISWHLYEILSEKGLLDNINIQRVVFHEITKKAVQEAIANPRDLSYPLINAQQARRALDYLVGFNLSPLLWKKIKYGLSAGRVQSPALRMIVERELEIEAFVAKEYWTLLADVTKDKIIFTSKLHTLKGKLLKQFDINTEVEANNIKTELLDAANGFLTVTRVEKKQRKRNPTAPFTTSTLQQEAARKIRFTTQRSMRIAQQLYEGIDLGSGSVGLITYMRTDSVTLATEAIEEIRTVIAERYGTDNVNPSPRIFKNKSKNAQEAHEAIRPTSVKHIPETIRQYLTDDQFKLYSLIWQRTMASQMIHATLNTVSADLAANTDSFFRATGSTIQHAGFMSVYQEGSDEPSNSKPNNSKGTEKLLPPLVKGELLSLKTIQANQHFTEPPPRFSEASLVKTLEEYGIGRPSTYASIISTLQSREYVELEARRFYPTDIGRIVTRFLTEHFNNYVDYDFTARLEDELDEVSRGEKEWIPLMNHFWKPFHELVVDKEKNVSRDEVMQAREIGIDPKSGKPISVRMGRYGPFVQIGTRDDEEKPKFASLRSGQKMDSVTLEDALVLFQLPRDLGETPEGEKISTNVGRFGPYVKYNNKFVSLKKDDDPYTITLKRALELIAEKKEIDRNRLIQDFPDNNIQILNGRWGPYITDTKEKKNAKIPKETDPKLLTLDNCIKMLAEAPVKKSRSAKKTTKKPTTKKTSVKKATKKSTTKKTSVKKTTKKPTTKTSSKIILAKKKVTKKTTIKKELNNEEET